MDSAFPDPNLERRSRLSTERIGQMFFDMAAKDAYIEDLRELVVAKDAEIAALRAQQEHGPLKVVDQI